MTKRAWWKNSIKRNKSVKSRLTRNRIVRQLLREKYQLDQLLP